MGKFIALIVAVLVVIGLWTGGWFYGAGEIRRGIAGLAEGDGEGEPRLTCGVLNVSGFPFRFDVECQDAAMISGDVTAKFTGFRVSLLVYNPTQVRLSALSPLTLADAFSGAQSRVDFATADGSARVVTQDLWRGLSGKGWRIGSVSIVADGVKWTDTVVGETPVMDAGHVEAHLVDLPEQHDAAAGTAALAAHATLGNVTAPGWQIAEGEATLEAELTGLPDDVRLLSAADVVERWQEAGGQLKLTTIKGAAGEEFIESSGTLRLDSAARLDGQIAMRHRGLVERFGDLIPEDWRGIVLGGPKDDGSYAQTITIKAGIVFSGLMPVSIIPPLF